MQITNVHTRELPVPAARLGALLDGLGAPGALERPARMPAFVRVADAVEETLARRRGLLPALPPPGRVTGRGARAAGVAVPAVLAGLALLHAAWALRWYVPAGDERELAKLVLGESERELLDGSMPPDAASWAVAGALAGAAALVRGTARGSLSRRLRGLTWGVAGVFLLRGTAMVPSELAGGPADAYERLDLAFYSPLCVGLAAGTAAVLRDGRRGAAVEARTTSSAGSTTRRLRRPAMLA